MAASLFKSPLGNLAAFATQVSGVLFGSDTSAPALATVAVDSVTGLPLSPAGTDSTGTALPANFDSLASDTSDRDGSGNLLSESRTDGTSTWTQTYTRDANGDITATSAWVKS